MYIYTSIYVCVCIKPWVHIGISNLQFNTTGLILVFSLSIFVTFFPSSEKLGSHYCKYWVIVYYVILLPNQCLLSPTPTDPLLISLRLQHFMLGHCHFSLLQHWMVSWLCPGYDTPTTQHCPSTGMPSWLCLGSDTSFRTRCTLNFDIFSNYLLQGLHKFPSTGHLLPALHIKHFSHYKPEGWKWNRIILIWIDFFEQNGPLRFSFNCYLLNPQFLHVICG